MYVLVLKLPSHTQKDKGNQERAEARATAVMNHIVVLRSAIKQSKKPSGLNCFWAHSVNTKAPVQGAGPKRPSNDLHELLRTYETREGPNHQHTVYLTNRSTSANLRRGQNHPPISAGNFRVSTRNHCANVVSQSGEPKAQALNGNSCQDRI